jgi:putative membrane protein
MHLRPLPLVITSVLVVGGLVYLRGWLCLRKALPKLIAGWQLAAFMSGLFTTWTAVASPLATLDHQSLTIHMMKHLLLMTVAAPLILAGAPIFPLMCGLPKLFITGDPPVRNWRARWLEHLPAHFVSCWLAGTVAVISWHLPGPFQLAMRSYWVKGTEEACFLFAGILFWSPIVQPLPSIRSAHQWSKALYLFLATLPCDVLSGFLVFCNRLVYSDYRSATPLFNLPPLQDQECAGALMWVWITFAYLIPSVVITMQILTPPHRDSGPPLEGADRLVVRSLNGSGARCYTQGENICP